MGGCKGGGGLCWSGSGGATKQTCHSSVGQQEGGDDWVLGSTRAGQ